MIAQSAGIGQIAKATSDQPISRHRAHEFASSLINQFHNLPFGESRKRLLIETIANSKSHNWLRQ